MGHETPKKVKAAADTAKMVPGDEPDANRWLKVKWLGIEFRRFKSKDMTVFATRWKNDETGDSHVYQIEIRPDGDSPNAGWRATARCDLRRLFDVSGKSRDMVQRAALAGMKAWLKRNHRKARRTWLAAKRRIQDELKEGEVRK